MIESCATNRQFNFLKPRLISNNGNKTNPTLNLTRKYLYLIQKRQTDMYTKHTSELTTG